MKAKCLSDMRKDLCLDPMYPPNKTGAVGACHPIAYIVTRGSLGFIGVVIWKKMAP